MVRMYICRAARWRAVSYFSSDPNLSNTTSLQLWRSRRGRGQQEVTPQTTTQRQQPCVCWGHYYRLNSRQGSRPEVLSPWTILYALSAYADTHLNIEVLKCYSVSPKQLHGILRDKSDAKEALHLMWPRPLRHLEHKSGDKGGPISQVFQPQNKQHSTWTEIVESVRINVQIWQGFKEQFDILGSSLLSCR